MPINLFDSFPLGPLKLPNRLVMAPMTRNRADANGVATPEMATYYGQRASAGLIVTESVPVSPQGVGYPLTPALHRPEHAAGWLRVVNAVHSAGGRIMVQLQHCGRISHPSFLDGETPVAPSAVRPEGQAYTYTGPQEFVTPRALRLEEMADVVTRFRDAAALARTAGFDGIEIHAGNGYLIDQFLRDGSNLRSDIYGGTPLNRLRLLNDVLDAVLTVWPSESVGIRLTPENSFNSMHDSQPQAHFDYFMEQLSSRGLAYAHVLEGDMQHKERKVDYSQLRSRFRGAYIANNGYDLDRAQHAIRSGAADLVAFGAPFLANPDLVRRYKEGLPLNRADSSTFFSGGQIGYTDYPAYRAAVAAAVLETA